MEQRYGIKIKAKQDVGSSRGCRQFPIVTSRVRKIKEKRTLISDHSSCVFRGVGWAYVIARLHDVFSRHQGNECLIDLCL